MTVVELVVAAAVLLLVSATLFAMLDSVSRHEARAERGVDNEEMARSAMNRVVRDIRAANPLDPLSTGTYGSNVQVELGSTGSTKTVVRWTYDASAKTLRRNVMSDNTASATVAQSELVLSGVQSFAFGYYGWHGEDLIATGLDATQMDDCTARVHVAMTAQPRTGPRAFEQSVDAGLRNKTPGGIACGFTV